MTEQEILFNNLKSIKDYWVKTSVDSLEENVELHDEFIGYLLNHE